MRRKARPERQASLHRSRRCGLHRIGGRRRRSSGVASRREPTAPETSPRMSEKLLPAACMPITAPATTTSASRSPIHAQNVRSTTSSAMSGPGVTSTRRRTMTPTRMASVDRDERRRDAELELHARELRDLPGEKREQGQPRDESEALPHARNSAEPVDLEPREERHQQKQEAGAEHHLRSCGELGDVHFALFPFSGVCPAARITRTT